MTPRPCLARTQTVRRFSIGLLAAILPPLAAQENVFTGSDLAWWNASANWSLGVVPSGLEAVATFTTNSPRIFNETVSVGSIVLRPTGAAAPAVYVGGYVPYPGKTVLRLTGVGIVQTADQPLFAGLAWTSEIHFDNSATLTAPAGQQPVIGFSSRLGDPHGDSFNMRVSFHDTSSAGDAALKLGRLNDVSFDGHGSAGTAAIETGFVSFRDYATAASSKISLRVDTAGGGSALRFAGHSTAGDATITSNSGKWIEFRDDSSAGHATILDSTESKTLYLGFGFVSFHDRATADGLVLRGSGTVSIGDSSSPVTIASVTPGANLGPTNFYLGSNTLRMLRGGIVGAVTGDATGTWLVDGNVSLSGAVTGVTTRVQSGEFGIYGPFARVAALEIEPAGSFVTDVEKLPIEGHLRNSGRLDFVRQTSAGPASRGRLAIAGDFTQTATGSLTLLALQPSDANRIAATGRATFGGAINVTSSLRFPLVGTSRFPLITAGSVQGKFDRVTITGPQLHTAMLDTRLDYSATDVALAQVQGSFAEIGATPAQRALGAHLDATLPSASGGHYNLLANLDVLAEADSVRAGLSQLSPQRYAALAEHAFHGAALRDGTLRRHLAAWLRATSDGFVAFAEGGARTERFASDAADDFPGNKFSVATWSLGAGWNHRGLVLGGSLGFDHGRSTLDGLGSEARTKTLVPGVFAQLTRGAWFANVSGASARQDLSLRRRLWYAGVDSLATAEVTAHRSDFALGLGRALRRGGWELTPQLGVLRSHWRADDFAETGAGAHGLAFREWRNRSLRGRAELEVAFRPSGRRFAPHLNIAWLREFERGRPILAGLADAGAYFETLGRRAAADQFHARLTLDVALARRTVLTTGLTAVRAAGQSVTGDLSAGLRWSF